MTSFEYDDAGLVTRSVTVREPEFSAWDRALFLDQWQRDKERRGSHGLLLSETTDPANQFAYDVPRNEKGMPTPGTDWAQKALDDAQAQYHAAYPDTPMGSKLWRVIRKNLGVLGEVLRPADERDAHPERGDDEAP